MDKLTTKEVKFCKRGGFSNPHRQSGYIIMVSVVLLGAMLLATLSYFERSADNIQMSGYNRDSAEALLLAESAMNTLYGQFKYGRDIDDDDIADRDQSFDSNNPSTLPTFYMYFVSGTEPISISQTQPTILQKIADGEARSAARTTQTVSSHRVPVDANNLVISELYTAGNTQRPVLYILDENNRLSISNDNWTNIINNNPKAAVAWLELVLSPTGNGTIQVYAQAAAQIGSSKNYVQRYVGAYPNTLGPLGAANESSL